MEKKFWHVTVSKPGLHRGFTVEANDEVDAIKTVIEMLASPERINARFRVARVVEETWKREVRALIEGGK